MSTVDRSWGQDVFRSQEPVVEIEHRSAVQREPEAWVDGALTVTLERLAGPAFVVGPGGGVLRANRAGRVALGRDREATLARVAASPLRHAVAKRGLRAYELVTLEPSNDDAKLRALSEGLRLGLTPRECEVLGLLVVGATNRAMGAALGCAEKTVEIHVSRILGTCGCPTRTALVARFWMGSLHAS